jgi:hypothetical protein
MQDEPVLGPELNAPQVTPTLYLSVVGFIRDLVFEVPYAVLSAHGGGRPYGWVVA